MCLCLEPSAYYRLIHFVFSKAQAYILTSVKSSLIIDRLTGAECVQILKSITKMFIQATFCAHNRPITPTYGKIYKNII